MLRLIAGLALAALVASPSLACGVGSGSRGATAHLPPLASQLDSLIGKPGLIADADLATVKQLRAEIARLAKAKDETAARKIEEQAMARFGYVKGWMACGPGTFFWFKPPPAKPAPAAAPAAAPAVSAAS